MATTINDCSEAEIAKYLPQKISEYIGNPMIEALPPILECEQDVAFALKCLTKVTESEKMESNLIKAHVLQKAKQLFIPLPIHLRLESTISVLIRSSYVYRNPMSAKFKRSLIELDNLKVDSENESIPDIARIMPASNPAQCIFVNGLSGMGKTTIIQKILNLYPQIIRHTEYKENLFTRTQIVWLKIDCPHDGSFVTLCRSVFQKIDHLTGERYEEKFGYLTRSASTMLMHLTHLLAVYNVGVLVIDEIQALLNSKDDTAQMLDFFVTLTNTMSMPIIFIGTNKARALFQSNLRLARRVQSDGYFEIGNLENHSSEWNLMTKHLFKMSVIDAESMKNSDITEAFYDETQGIIALLVMLFVFIQNAAMLERTDRITPEFVHKIAKRDLSFVQPMINALRSNNPLEISKYDDLTIDENAIVKQYQHDLTLDEDRKKMIEEIMDKTKNDRKTTVDSLYSDFYVSKLFNNLTETVMKRLIETIVNENPSDMNFEDLKDICHDRLYEEDRRRRHKKTVKPEIGTEGLVVLYEKAISNKRHPYDVLKENGYIKDPNTEFFRA